MCSCARHITRIGLGLCNNELRTVDTRHVTRDTGHRTPDTWKCSKAGNETNLFAWRVRGPNGWLPHCQLVEIPIHSIWSVNRTSRNFTIDSACKVNHRRVASSIVAVGYQLCVQAFQFQQGNGPRRSIVKFHARSPVDTSTSNPSPAITHLDSVLCRPVHLSVAAASSRLFTDTQ